MTHPLCHIQDVLSLLDSLNIVDPNKSVQKDFAKSIYQTNPNERIKDSSGLQTMSHCQKFPQDDTLSHKLDSLSCSELLKKNLPTSKALHSLRMKIQQQKLRREFKLQHLGERPTTSYQKNVQGDKQRSALSLNFMVYAITKHGCVLKRYRGNRYQLDDVQVCVKLSYYAIWCNLFC